MRQIVKKMLMAFTVCMVTVLGLTSPASSAPYTVTQATLNNYNDINPKICKNGDMVWSYNDDIFIKDGTTGLTRQLTNNGVSDSMLDVNDNGDIVWLQVNIAELDTNVMLYTKATNTILRISLPANPLFQHSDNNPQLNNLGQVVYESYDNNDQEVMLYSGGTVTQVTNNTLNDNTPRINNNGDIVWRASAKGSSNGDIWLRTAGTTTQLTATPNDDTGARINNTGDIAWSGSDGANYQIWYYTQSTGTGQKTKLTSTPVDNINVRINANGYLAWTAGTETSDYETWRRTGLNGTSSNISQQPSHDDINPRINDNGWVTWQEDQGVAATNDQIFVFDGTTATRLQTDANDHINPMINYYNTVVWQGTGGTGATSTDYEIWVGLTGLCADAAARCNDNDACTYDSCNPETGACVHTTVVCNDSNACTNDACNTATGCVYTAIPPCNDNNACTSDACNTATGCVYTLVVCNDGNLCTTDTCVPATGCVYTPKCNDNNLCTTDSCNTTTGACTNTPVVCNDNNLCTTDACNTATGQCTYTLDPVSCPTTTDNTFTMLDTGNNVVGGTNDIVFSWDGVKKTSVAASGQIANALLTSSCIYSSAFWSAHDLAVYGPGSYTIYTACPAGSPGCGLTSDPTGVNCPVGNTCPPINFTVKTGELGIHMLFNWGGNTNIDVVNVLKPNAKFEPSPMWSGFCGYNSSCTVWGWMSYDPDTDSDNFNGVPMVDGPFPGFSPNFSYNKVTPVDLCCDAATRCNDNDACTTDACDSATGDCSHTAVVCNDNYLCTVDSCNSATGCVYAPKNCSDNDACTADSCDPVTGDCRHTPIVCSDNNPCTSDTCNPLFGCVYPPVTCNDNNVCTTDTCNTANGACVFTNNTASCSDNNACTLNDICSGGTCSGTAKVCNDNNVCTTDTCNTANGACVFTNNTASCSDNNACTQNDTCSGGACSPGTARVCLGGVACDTATGCSSSTHGNNFTMLMSGGYALGGTNDVKLTWDGVAQDAAAFNNGNGLSNATLTSEEPFAGSTWTARQVQVVSAGTYSVDLDGGGPGTNLFEVTIPAGKIGVHLLLDWGSNTNLDVWLAWDFNTAFAAGKLFTGSDNGITGASPIDGSPNATTAVWGLASIDLAGRIKNAAGNTITNLPVDGNPGISIQDPGGLFGYSANFNAMLTDLCADAATRCNDNNPCTADLCNVTTGACVNNTKTCTDNNKCTTDTCNTATGACVYTPVVIDDNNACTTDSCNPATGVITHTPKNCNDNNVCTTDTCNTTTGVCVNTPVACNDNNACTTDTCNTVIGCVYTDIPCDDGNLCTTDTCNPATGCVYTNNTLTCDDSNICTENDVCSGGACGGTTKSCYSGGVCDPATGCPPVDTHGNNLSILMSNGYALGGTNDVKFWWDGALLDEATFANGDGMPNASITSEEPFASWLWSARQVQIVGPGTYWVYLDGVGPDTNRFEVTIPAGKIGAHLLFDWGSTDPGSAGYCGKISCGADVWLAWDFNKSIPAGKLFTGSDNGITGASPIDGNPTAGSAVFDLASVDLAGRITDSAGNTITNLPLDGNPGISMQDGMLTSLTVNFNTMLRDLCTDGAVRCNDNSVCTTDFCDTTTGACVNISKNCSDGNACTTDTCNPTTGVCSSAPVVIDDNNACTTDSCNTRTGLITHTPKNCNDNNVCTIDSCNTTTGVCVYTQNACNDNNACTVDTCTAMNGCIHTGITCDDGNFCTDDDCSPASGCVYTNNTLACDDGNMCTENDACSGGVCGGAAKVCYGGGVCDPGTGCPMLSTSGNNLTLMMSNGFVVGGTNDVILTWDGTLQDEATFANGYGWPNATITSDEPFAGSPWTARQVQVVGPGTYWVYLDGAGIDPTRYEVTIPAGKIGAHLLFDWGTTSDADVWIAWEFNTAFAAGKLWTGADNGITSNGGVRDGHQNTTTTVWGVASVDLAGRLTDDAGNTITNLPLDGIPGIPMKEGTLINYSANFNAMLQDLCADAAVRCNDNNICTTDSCNAATGACEYTAVVPASCNDNNICTTDGCAANACTHTATVPASCTDNNICTTDGCAANACTHTATVPASCDDNDNCTTDTCTSNSCGHTTLTCPANQSCDPATGACDWCYQNVTIVGGGGTTAVDQQIQTKYTVQGTGCIRAYTTSSVTARTGSTLTYDCTVGTSMPTSGTLNGSAINVTTCTGVANPLTTNTLYLTNGGGGSKDTDTMTIN